MFPLILGAGGVADTPAELLGPEEELLRAVGGTTALWCGRAATALFFAYRLALRGIPPSGDAEVILPAISCATPANVACLAGLRPRFADVDPETGLLSLESAKARWTERTRALVFIHLYGQSRDLADLEAWCKSKNVLLIEDNAQALGGHVGSRSIGSWGGASVYSFNPTKIIEPGGAALVVRSSELRERLHDEVSAALPLSEVTPGEAAQLANSYRNLHHGLAALLRLRPSLRIADLFLGVRAQFDPLLMRALRDPRPLGNAWRLLPSALQYRRENAELYSLALNGGPWRLLDGWRSSGVCWRYSLLLDRADLLVDLSEAVRRDGFHVSNLYWPVPPFFHPDDACPAADAFARRIINLWVDPTVSPETVKACATSLQANAKSMHARNSAPSH